jgi:hypothetical protein
MDKFIGKKECFTPENIKKIVDEKKLTSVANLERALFSLEYVGQLWESGADIVFKGGSAVQILLGDTWNRLSVDADICTELSVTDIESHWIKFRKDLMVNALLMNTGKTRREICFSVTG